MFGENIKAMDGAVEIEDDAEVIVIDHPGTVGQNGVVPHVHTNRQVVCKKSAKEITLEPMINYPGRHRYLRTDDKDVFGRTIFREQK